MSLLKLTNPVPIRSSPMFCLGDLAKLLSLTALASALPSFLPLTLNEGFWFGQFSIGDQTFSLNIDTGSLPILIGQGRYLPSSSSRQTALKKVDAYFGPSKDGSALAEEDISFVLDDVRLAGVVVGDFLVGNATSGDPLPGDGTAGFGPPASNFSVGDNDIFVPGQGLIETMCKNGAVSPCQFGLALGRNGSGSLILGSIETKQITGGITTLQTAETDYWVVDSTTMEDLPIVVVDGRQFGHIVPTFDSATPNVIGPVAQVRAILHSLGYDIAETTVADNITVVLGTYDCSRKPARFGFQFPPSTAVHYVDTAANMLNRTADGKTCTANILGSSSVGPREWLIGQTWFQGRYVQHDLDSHTISFADLAYDGVQGLWYPIGIA